MACSNRVALYCALLVALLFDPTGFSSHAQLLPVITGDPGRTQIYIVRVATPDDPDLLSDEDLESWHRSFLPNTTLDSGAPRLVYSYRHATSGFAARLTPEELAAMSSMDGFLHARPDRLYQLATTYTPKLLGLNKPIDGVWDKGVYGAGVIIGVLDTGIHRTHPSFGDSGMPPVPARWKGGCTYAGFPCNNKIIGAKAFYSGQHPTPMDTDGHGTHVASIAAGNFVADANVLGMARGTASGMAPKAHLAIYKVCFNTGRGVRCPGSDTLAAIDQAISDGVDVISMSIGGEIFNQTMYEDDVAEGSLAAFKMGISPCASAGNSGPEKNTLSHSAPWVMTVGASSTDRRIRASVTLGDGKEFHGESAFQPKSFDSSKFLPAIFPGTINLNAVICERGSLDQIDVRGKVVFCFLGNLDDTEKGEVVYAAGGAAVILANLPAQAYTTASKAHVLPAVQVSYEDGVEIREYIKSSAAPTVSIKFKSTQFGFRPSPAVASFSSRGPSEMNGDIIKPDVLAPGVNILAAWPSGVGPKPAPFNTKTFNFLSGTSMAAPHVSGVIALIKSKHRQWSPAAIQSAIITSAKELDLAGTPIMDEKNNSTAGVYDTGAGQLNPAGAMDPGLVYDLTHDDYISYLCGLGYTPAEIYWTVHQRIDCSKRTVTKPLQLNYPSIAVSLGSKPQTLTVDRTVTNVGKPTEDYHARIQEPAGVTVSLSDYQLRFSRAQQDKSFNVSFELKKYPGKGVISRGKLEWVSADHVVTSPIAVRFT